MRTLAFAILVVSSPAYADGFVELAGGLMLPVADEQWVDYVDSGPKLGARVGAVSGNIGGMLSVDWTPINADDDGFSGVGTMIDVDANRFRVLANIVTHQRVGGKLTAVGRGGLGIDHQTVNVKGTVFGIAFENDDSDTGLALEVGGGLWFDVTPSVQLGIEAGLPISLHNEHEDDDLDLEDFTTFDIDILFGVRFFAGR